MQDHTASKKQSLDFSPTTLHFTNQALSSLPHWFSSRRPWNKQVPIWTMNNNKKILEITFYVIFCEKHTCVWRSLKYKFIWIAYRISKLHVWQLSQHIYPQFFVVVFPVLKNTRSDCILETKARKVSLTPLWPLPLFIILTNSIQIFLI